MRSTVLLLIALTAQTPADPSFEAASVKQNVSGDRRSGTGNSPGGRVNVTNQTLRQIIRNAYGSSDIDVVGGPGWIDSERWDIAAVAGTGEADPPWRLMLRSLLVDRFKLQAHIESREQPIYNLTLARRDGQLGPSIHETLSDVQCSPKNVCGGDTQASTNGIASGVINGKALSMAGIAQALSRYAERRVFDQTGLDKRYDFELRWEDTSIFTAVGEQLGLKLQAGTGPVDVVVVDHVERPTPD